MNTLAQNYANQPAAEILAQLAPQGELKGDASRVEQSWEIGSTVITLTDGSWVRVCGEDVEVGTGDLESILTREVEDCMAWWAQETGSEPDERTAEDCAGSDWDGVRSALPEGTDLSAAERRYRKIYLHRVKYGY